MSRHVRVEWESTSNRIGSAKARHTKNAIVTYMGGKERWVTWPDRFDKQRGNGKFVLRCRICGECWGHCECDVGWP